MDIVAVLCILDVVFFIAVIVWCLSKKDTKNDSETQNVVVADEEVVEETPYYAEVSVDEEEPVEVQEEELVEVEVPEEEPEEIYEEVVEEEPEEVYEEVVEEEPEEVYEEVVEEEPEEVYEEVVEEEPEEVYEEVVEEEPEEVVYEEVVEEEPEEVYEEVVEEEPEEVYEEVAEEEPEEVYEEVVEEEPEEIFEEVAEKEYIEEEPEEVYEEVAETSDVEESDGDAEGKEKLQINRVPFAKKLLQLDDNISDYYNIIYNFFNSYRKVNPRVSRACVSFRNGRELVAKLSIRGKTMKLHLALDINNYDEKIYFQKDASDVKAYREVPFTVKVKSDRGLKRALELITSLCEEKGIERKTRYTEIDAMKEINEKALLD